MYNKSITKGLLGALRQVESIFYYFRFSRTGLHVSSCLCP